MAKKHINNNNKGSKQNGFFTCNMMQLRYYVIRAADTFSRKNNINHINNNSKGSKQDVSVSDMMHLRNDAIGFCG